MGGHGRRWGRRRTRGGRADPRRTGRNMNRNWRASRRGEKSRRWGGCGWGDNMTCCLSGERWTKTTRPKLATASGRRSRRKDRGTRGNRDGGGDRRERSGTRGRRLADRRYRQDSRAGNRRIGGGGSGGRSACRDIITKWWKVRQHWGSRKNSLGIQTRGAWGGREWRRRSARRDRNTRWINPPNIFHLPYNFIYVVYPNVVGPLCFKAIDNSAT